MRRLSLTTKALAGAALVLSMSAANAITVNFYNGSSLFATMTTSGGTDFDLYFIGTGYSSAYIDYLDMAGPFGAFSSPSGQQTVATATYSASGFTDAGKTYNWKIDFPNPNNATRMTTGEHFLWSIAGTDPSVWNFDLLHINAFDGLNSIKLDGCIAGTTGCTPSRVPEPGTLALLGLGLIGLGAVRRKTA